MTTIVLRANTPAGLTNNQIDTNFTNLNNDKIEVTDAVPTNTSDKVVKRDSSGNFAANIITCVDLNSSSDARLKDKVTRIENALDIVDQLEGVRFVMKNDPDNMKIGLIAQNVEEIIPEVVGEDFDGMKTVAYGNIVSVLIEAVKELSAKVEELESKLDQK